MRALVGLTPLALLLTLAACPTHVVSPPLQLAHLDSPALLPEGGNALAGEAALGSAVFGPELAVGGLRYRHGVNERLEVQASTNLGWVTSPSGADTFRGIFAGRLGIKGAIAEADGVSWLSGYAGAGAGVSAGGAYSAIDLGLVIGYENRWLVPYLALGGVMSLPINPKEVDIRHAERDPEDGPVLDRPHATFGYQLTAGLRYPAIADALDLHVAFPVTMLMDTRGNNIGFFGLAFGATGRF